MIQVDKVCRHPSKHRERWYLWTRTVLALWLVGSSWQSFAVAAEPEFSREQIEHFEKQIRPVLAAQCWNCHSDTKQESGLRLDSREAVLRGGDRGASVISGMAQASLLLHAIRRDDELQMPPNGRLSAEQVAAFSRWIDQGLPWPRDIGRSAKDQAWQAHWAFQPVIRPTIPAIANDQWSASPVDRFVLEKLNGAGTHPAATADRRTLIRRVTFDLLGLPPAADEVDAFVADSAPDAWERLIDRLLASPRYGERWGRHWLDLARYADNKGYVFFEEQSYPWAYTYRDYVIRAFNEDLPYDQFILEQLAADLLERRGDDRSLAAMGYLTVGSHFMGNVHDIIDDRIDVVTRGLMGLTVTCARCHDHKYDPVPTADYYSLYGVFRSSVEPLVPPVLTPPKATPEYARFSIELSVRQQNLDDLVQQKHSALVEGARTRAGEYLLAAREAASKPAIDDFMLIADPGDLNPAMIVRWQAYLEKLTAKKVAVAKRESSIETGSKCDATTTKALPSHPVWDPWLTLSTVADERFADEAQQYLTASQRRDSTTVNPLVTAALVKVPFPTSITEVAQRYGELFKSIHLDWQAELREAVILKRPTPVTMADPDREAIRLELYGEHAPANVPLVFGWGFLSLLPDRASQAEYQKVLKDVEQWIINGPGAPPRAMMMHDGELFEPQVFQRGNPNRLGAAIPRRFLSALHGGQPFAHGSGRLELAQAIVDPQNPLTARVLVNRLWQQHFGAGLVRTPSDFGLRSDPPTHPALLDWLAMEFVGTAATVQKPALSSPHRSYSIKRIHRQLVSSQTYQLSSTEPTDIIDPDNRLWNRANRKRLDFEATRDALLVVTDQLQDRIGGPSQNLLDGFQPRRTLYSYLNRLDLPGLLSVFDFPSPAASSGQRETTTISPQALFLMNGTLIGPVADAVQARADLATIADPADRVRQIYRILFQRLPGDHEAELARQFLSDQPTPAAWSQLVHALLMTNEFVFVD